MKVPNDIKRSIEGENRERNRRILENVATRGWSLLKRGDSFDPNAARETSVVGVAVWDNQTMDALAAMAKAPLGLTRNIVVFNMDDCSTWEELTRFVPGAKEVLQAPVVAEYREGQLIRKLEGTESRQWMEKKAK